MRDSGNKTSVQRHDEAIGEAQIAELSAEMDDLAMWGDVEELGPGFYRAPEVAEQLGSAIVAYRAAHRVTQKQLARTLALHQSQIARLEAGQHTPSLETLVRVARHLGLSPTLTVTPEGASLRAATQSGTT